MWFINYEEVLDRTLEREAMVERRSLKGAEDKACDDGVLDGVV